MHFLTALVSRYASSAGKSVGKAEGKAHLLANYDGGREEAATENE